MSRPAPPRDEAELLARATALAGRTVGEVGASLGVIVPPDARRAKGLVGRLVEDALGAHAGSKDLPDFPDLGVELKTIPLDARGRPAESTFVCSVQLGRIESTDFADSLLWRKLRRVLWVPVEADRSRPLPGRRLGAPSLWSPDPAQEAALRGDWEALAELASRGELDAITARFGQVLQIRPKAANARARRRAPDADGGIGWTLPRGFYLRARFTRTLFERAGR